MGSLAPVSVISTSGWSFCVNCSSASEKVSFYSRSHPSSGIGRVSVSRHDWSTRLLETIVNIAAASIEWCNVDCGSALNNTSVGRWNPPTCCCRCPAVICEYFVKLLLKLPRPHYWWWDMMSCYIVAVMNGVVFLTGASHWSTIELIIKAVHLDCVLYCIPCTV